MSVDGKKIGLALSGGGYRAAAYHIGTLRALRKLGILDKVDVISSISGGSIIAAYYALHKDEFENLDNFAPNFKRKLQDGPFCIVLIALLTYIFLLSLIACGLVWLWHCECVLMCIKIYSTLIITFIEGYLLLNHNKYFCSSKMVERYYNKFFFENKTLKDLPDTPLIAINATEVTQNQLMTFSKLKVACGSNYPQGIILPDEIPVSLAVMASSAYPLFSPVTISAEYFADMKKDVEEPVLIDGGIYDNQGLHKLGERKSAYGTDFSIVSNAGNAELNDEGMGNVITLLYKVMELLMNRIEKMQMRKALYQPVDPHIEMEKDKRCAYVALMWTPSEEAIDGYLNNIQDSLVPRYVYEANGINEEQAERLRQRTMTQEERRQCNEIVKEHIKWAELCENQNKVIEAWARAKNVGTNLKGLKKTEINALVTLAEWQTILQVRLHLPHLIHERV